MSSTTLSRQDLDSPKRRAVLDAAGELFIAHGYGAVSMDAVARAAGVSKATLYAHFAFKDRLFATIVSEGCQAKFAIYEALPEPGEDLALALTVLGEGMLRFVLEERSLSIHRIVIAESARFPELGEAFYLNGPAHFIGVFGDWLRAQSAAGRLDVADPEMAAEQFMGLIRGTVYRRAMLGLAIEAPEAAIRATVAAAVRTFLKAYAPA